MNTPRCAKYILLKLSLIYSLSIFCFPQMAFGQTPKFEFFSSADHLSSPIPWMMEEDDEGFLWFFGLGIDRYDGYNFVNIKSHENSYDYTYEGKYYVSSKDHFIFKTDDYFYLREIKTGHLDSIYYRDLLTENQMVNVHFFHELQNGEYVFFFWNPSNFEVTFLTLENGKLKEKFKKTNVGTGDKRGFYNITSDNKNNYYYLNRKQDHYLKINSEGQLLQKIPCPQALTGVSFFKIGHQNTFYICSNNELFFLDEGAEKIEVHPANHLTTSWGEPVNDILELPNGDLWITGNDRNLIYYKKSTNQIIDYRNDLLQLIPRRVNLWSFLMDKTGVIWVNSTLGIIKIIPQQSLFDNYFSEQMAECKGYCSFRGMTESEDGQIYASFYNSIFQINPKTKTTEKPFPNLISTPMGIGYDDGHLLLNSGERWNIHTGGKDSSFHSIQEYGYDVGIMTQDDLGNWWNAQFGDVWFYDSNSKNPKWEKRIEVPETMSNLYVFFGEKSKKLWIADGYRVFDYDIDKNIITKKIELPEGHNIFKIWEDENKKIWLGTNNGLIVWDLHQNSSTKYTTKDGLPHDLVCSILPEGDSCLWLATNYGLSRFQKEKETFTNFYTHDGLTHNEFNRGSAYQAKDGQMFFGGMQGVNAFYPQEVMQKYQQKQGQGKVVLSLVSKIDESLDTLLTQALELNEKGLEFFHWDKSITFEYCLTDFRNPQKTQFSYQLEGYDKVWSTPSKFNFAKYSSLPAGDYIFRARAFDDKGSWNPNELAIPIKVYPPWWKTTWAYLIYSLIFCGIFYGGYRVLLYRMKLESQVEFEQKEGLRLKELDSFKSRLFTNLTHEFRTPLTVILGMAKQVSKGTQELQVDKNIQNRLLSQTELIEKNGQGLLRLVNQLLDLSKLENNAFTLNLKNDDILPFLNYTVSSFQSFANQQNLAIKFSTNLSKLEMDFDANCLQQVMTNLISNAIKFTHSGGTVFTDVRQVKKSKNHFLQIEIRDTGIGISPEKLPNIFDRFYQVDGSTTRAGEGTGIGLAHSKELTKLMGGEILVKSILNEGTTFFVNIPIKNEIQKVEKLKENDLSKNQSLPPSFIFDGKRIDKIAHEKIISKITFPKLLLIEDNPDVVTYLKTCLEKDYEIEVAFNGRIGIEKAIENIPDLIISDVMMPEKDGYEVCDFLKNDERTSHIPIVLLTAKADVDSKIDGLKRGANAYLSKPFVGKELEVRLKMLLENQKRMQAHFSPKEFLTTADNVRTEEITTSLISEDIKIENVFLQKIETILEENFADDNFALPQLCQKIGMSRSQLFRKLKALTGESPSRFIRTYRLKKAKLLLLTTELNVSEVARETGFASLPHFSRVYQEEFGFSPSATSN